MSVRLCSASRRTRATGPTAPHARHPTPPPRLRQRRRDVFPASRRATVTDCSRPFAVREEIPRTMAPSGPSWLPGSCSSWATSRRPSRRPACRVPASTAATAIAADPARWTEPAQEHEHAKHMQPRRSEVRHCDTIAAAVSGSRRPIHPHTNPRSRSRCRTIGGEGGARGSRGYQRQAAS